MRRSNPARYSIFVVSLLVLSAAGSTALAQTPDTGTLVAQAQTLMQEGNSAKAMVKLDQALARDPKDLQARFLKGVLLTEMNKLDEAAAVFTRLTQDAPQLPEPYNNLAVIYAQQKQYDKAKAALEMAIRTNPSYAVANENLGDLYAKMAREAYDRALQMDSSNTKAQAKLNLLRQITTGPVLPEISARKTPAAPAVAPKRPMAVASTSQASVTRPAPGITPPVIAATRTPPPAPAPVPPAKMPVRPASPEVQTAAKGESAGQEAERRKVAAVVSALHAWAHAWSEKDARSYLGYYAPDFEVPGNRPRKDWEAERTQRVTKPGSIHVTLTEINVQLDGEKATARFKQHYDSANFKSASGKTLTLVEHKGHWLIQKERIGR